MSIITKKIFYGLLKIINNGTNIYTSFQILSQIVIKIPSFNTPEYLKVCNIQVVKLSIEAFLLIEEIRNFLEMSNSFRAGKSFRRVKDGPGCILAAR